MMAVTMMILIVMLFGLQLLPEVAAMVYAPYVYAAVLVLAFQSLRTQVRKLAFSANN